uniref:Immunoglobulin V-set domain-containing protein n=1 Tax=Poecilia formosa TaxID=48698 RepID=A0A096M3Q1_POEFO
MALTVAFLFHLLLLYTLQMQGSSAVTDVFVKTGDDLILNLTTEIPSDATVWSWQFTNKAIVTFITGSKPTVQKSHTGRVEVLDEKYSVRLKNLQKSDSGIYTAKVTTPIDTELTQYNVTVQDPVSPVELTFTCAFGSSSSYNLTATCRTDDSSISITMRWENQTCNQEGEERRSVTKSGSSLHIYKLKESIVCNHSNQVSRNESKENIENHCTLHGEPRKHHWYLLLILLAFLLFFIYIGYRKRKKTGDNGNFDNTIYALPERKDQTETSKETAEDESCSPTTTYSTVGSSLSKGATNMRGNDQPESVYSQIKAV